MTARLQARTERTARWLARKAAELDRHMKTTMLGAGKIVEKEAKESFLPGGYERVRAGRRTWRVATPPPHRDRVYRRTGHASRSINTRTRKVGRDWVAAVGSPVKYLKALEEGTTRVHHHPKRRIVVGVDGGKPVWRTITHGGRIHPRRVLAGARDRKRAEVDRFVERRLALFARNANREGAA